MADLSQAFALPVSHEQAVIVTRPCIKCGLRTAMIATRVEAARWLKGDEHVQNIFTTWNADQRETLISGTHPTCWTLIFGSEEE